MEDEPHGAAPEPTPPALEAPDEIACPVVGIGASAGGIDALKRLFPAVKPGINMAFIVVQHLDPEHESALPDILSRSTPLPVTAIEDETALEPDHVYVGPPNATATIHGGRLRLTRPALPRGHRNPIDELFISLARDQAENAACVILSGTGSDGTLGLRAIKDNGGLTLAQAEAEYDGMMRSAVATGLVDFVLRAEDIPAKLTEYFEHITRIGRHDGGESVRAEAVDHLHQITALLRAHTGHDFSDYKDRTIIRRVQRRMHVLQIDDVQSFIDRLRQDSREVTLLFHDLLIGVTNFFRDPEAFRALEQRVIPNLFEGKDAEEAVRVWVPGCATGEEAYSIAILLREHAPGARSPRLQIFASDIDEQALEFARVGRYPAAVAKDIPPALLERYFLREDGTLRIASELREMCLFSAHNLLRDAPFSRLDLISCRNLLIYLGADLQDRVIPLFHYALNPNGYLFLGTSENVTRHSRMFLTTDKKHRIFRRRATLERQIPEFPLSPPSGSGRAQPLARHRAPAAEPSLKATVERQLLDRFAPAYVVVDAEGDVVQSSGRTGKYLELPAGSPDINILNMARSGLRLDLRAALHKAASGGLPVVQSKVIVGTNGGRQEIDLHIQPLRFGTPPDALYLVVFQDIGELRPVAEAEPLPVVDDAEGASVRHLEAELRSTRERLQTTTEELESSNEELKSSNEELQSINEEMQSTNEELETSKEEMQSINEELQTVNAELNVRVEELSRANNDMNNLLESTQIATVFLDRGLLVKSFTPAAKDVFHLVESDTGRPVMHVWARFDASDGLQEDAERVLRTLATIEKPVASTDNGTRFMMRMLPYRTADNVINGVVITFTDVTRVTAAEARIAQLARDLSARVSELETLLDLVPVGVMIAEEGDAGRVLINRYGARLLGENADGGLLPVPAGFHLFEGDAELAPEDQPLQRAARTGIPIADWQGRLTDAVGHHAHVMMSATPLFGEGGRVRGAIAAIVDMTAHKHAEAQQQFLMNELQHRVKNVLATVGALAGRMARGKETVAEYHEALVSRLNAMGRTHELLSSGAWRGAGLRQLVQAAVEPFRGDGAEPRVRIAGDDIRLAPATATTMGMVVHELATNAAKYGALSVPGGRVSVSWERANTKRGADLLDITWAEAGGPRVDPASQPGFGSGFITRSMEYELGGTARLEFRPEGVRCHMQIPLDDNVDQPFAQ